MLASNPKIEHAAAIARTEVMYLLDSMRVPIASALPADPDGVVEQGVRDRIDAADFSPERYNKLLRIAVSMASVFSHTSVQTRVEIAIYTMLLLLVDDFDIPEAATAAYLSRLGRSKQLHPALDALTQNLLNMGEHFPPYAAQSIATSAFNHLGSTCLEQEISSWTINEGSLRYVDYLRIKTGIGEGYAFFIWDMINFPDIRTYVQTTPDVELILGYVNDIMSFYKEELQGDDQNMINLRARATKKDIGAVLHDVVDEVLAATNRVRTVLVGAKEKAIWEEFLSRYLTFHYLSPRYKLQEIITL